MIFATVGTHQQGFDRFVQAFDLLALQLQQEDESPEELVIQYGTSAYIPQHATAFQWATSQKMDELTQSARVVVTHAAAGAIILGLRAQKPLVVVPRLKKFDEHMDDHQLQLAQALDETGQAVSVAVPTASSVAEAIAKTSKLSQQSPNRTNGASQLKLALRQRMTALQQEKVAL